jgi:AcrR family transcriptional regulator
MTQMTKKQKIEHTAKMLFFKHGFKKVTIDEICRKSHVSRKTYYTYYDNKISLVLFILDEISQQAINDYKQIIESDEPFAKKLELSLLKKYEFGKSISMEFVADFLDPGASELLEYWKNMSMVSMKLLTDFLSEGQRTGQMNPDLDLNFVLWHFQKTSEAMKSPEMIQMFNSAEDMMKQMTQLLVFGIVNKQM